MDDDPQFNLEVVREYMITKNFKVSNRDLVSHFKPFLTHSDKREVNREKFRDYVNTLSTVKQDENGEKILVLKKKYRKGMPASVSSDSLSAEKKQDKKKDKQPSPDRPASESASTTVDMISNIAKVISSVEGAAAADSSANSSCSLVGAASPEMEQVPPSNLRPPSLMVTKPSLTDDTDGPGVSKPEVTGVVSPTETGPTQDEVFDNAESPQNLNPENEDDFKPVLLANSMSVKERAKHLNKIDSDSNLQNVKMRKHRKSPLAINVGDRRDDDSSSVSSGGYVPMDQTDRDWMITVSTADYHPMHRLLNQRPELAKRRDFITSALHWAAKHGKAEVIKLLCGVPGVNVNARSGYTPLHMAAMHGFEDIIELLVHGYHADPNLRDYSGKKAKQYLRNSASSRTHQILQARRPSSGIVNGNQPFKRVGSYSAKIQKSGFFGIHGGSAVRSSWAAGSDAGSDKDRTSPAPSLSPSASPRSSPLPSPRSRRKGSKPPRPPPPKLPPRPPPRRRKGSQGTKCGPSPLVKAISERHETGSTAGVQQVGSGKPPIGKQSNRSVPRSKDNESTPATVDFGKAENQEKTNQVLDLSDIKEEESFEYVEKEISVKNEAGDSDCVKSDLRKDEFTKVEEGIIEKENGTLSEQAPYVYLPHQGESSDYLDDDKFQGGAKDINNERNEQKKTEDNECEEEDDEEGLSGVCLMDRFLGGSSSTDPEPYGKKDDMKDTQQKNQKDLAEDDDDDDEWAQSLRSQSAFLLSSGFFKQTDKDESQDDRQHSRTYHNDDRRDPRTNRENNPRYPRTYPEDDLHQPRTDPEDDRQHLRTHIEDDLRHPRTYAEDLPEDEDLRYQSPFLLSAGLFSSAAREHEQDDMYTAKTDQSSQLEEEDQIFQSPFLRSVGLVNEGSRDDDRDDQYVPTYPTAEPTEEEDLRYQSAFLQSAGFFSGYARDDVDQADDYPPAADPYQDDGSEAERLRLQSSVLQSAGYFRGQYRNRDDEESSSKSQYYQDDPSETEDLRYQSPFLQSTNLFGQPEREQYQNTAYGASTHKYEDHRYDHGSRSDYPDRFWSGAGDYERQPSNPYQMTPYTYYEETLEEDPPMVAPPRRRRGQQQQQQPESVAVQASPLPPPRRRRSQKEATAEATGQQFSKVHDQEMMPPPQSAPSRKKRSRKDQQDKENVNRMPRPQSVPSSLSRAASNPDVSGQPITMTPAPVTSPFI